MNYRLINEEGYALGGFSYNGDLRTGEKLHFNGKIYFITDRILMIDKGNQYILLTVEV